MWPFSGLRPSRATDKTLRETELAAEAFKVQLQYLDVLDPKNIETAFQAAGKGRADALLVLSRANLHFSSNPDGRTRGKEPVAGDILQARICR